MALEPTLAEQEALADSSRRQRSRMSARELLAGALAGTGFAGAVGCVWVLSAPHRFAPIPVGLCILVLAVATRVRFDTPGGVAVPTQLAFVPLLFVAPLAIVPLAVVLARTLGSLPDVVFGKTPASRLLHVPGNSWYSLGPVAVFLLANTDARHAGPGLLLAALIAQFALDLGVAALRAMVATGNHVSMQLGEAWAYAIDAALSCVGLVVAKDLDTTPAAVLALVPLLGVFAVFGRERHRRLEGLLELNNAYRGTALVLGDVVEADDSYTGEHCKSVLELALAVADRLELAAERRRNLEFAALLHDVGKIAIPKQILNKPGKLDPDEWEVIKTHTVEGQRMLERVGGFMSDVGQIVRSHHERWDGIGYPDRLTGEAIPLEARIIACCDAWNAMRTDRVYRKALGEPQAISELASNARSQFDPRIVETLLAVVAARRTREISPAGPTPTPIPPVATTPAANHLLEPGTTLQPVIGPSRV
jgi:putative nucleotidyltransferase with HDIG domain